MLTFIVLACQMNVSIPDENISSCKIFKEPIVEELQQIEMTPMTCMMQSPVMVVKFEENHPGWQVRKWSCKYIEPTADL